MRIERIELRQASNNSSRLYYGNIRRVNFMKRFIGVLFIAFFSNSSLAIDLSKIDTPFYSKVRMIASGEQPVEGDLYFDGQSKLKLILPPTNTKIGKLNIIGELDTNRYFYWVQDSPKKTAFVMKPDEFSATFGIDTSQIIKQGTKTGEDRILGESCDIWELDISVPVPTSSEDFKSSQKICVTHDGIQLQGFEDDTLSFEMIELKRGSQKDINFELPQGYKIIDLSEVLKALQGLDITNQ